MMQADGLGGTMWRVTDGDDTWTVCVRSGDNTAEAAVAVVQEMLSPAPEVVAAQAVAARQAAAREECRRRILAVVPETAQVNLTAAAAAGLLAAGDLASFKTGLGWIAAMRAAWAPIAAGAVPPEAAAWPPAPPEVASLAARY